MVKSYKCTLNLDNLIHPAMLVGMGLLNECDFQTHPKTGSSSPFLKIIECTKLITLFTPDYDHWHRKCIWPAVRSERPPWPHIVLTVQAVSEAYLQI